MVLEMPLYQNGRRSEHCLGISEARDTRRIEHDLKSVQHFKIRLDRSDHLLIWPNRYLTVSCTFDLGGSRFTI
jgi:hypothetical protein